jgi:hypothetical protein
MYSSKLQQKGRIELSDERCTAAVATHAQEALAQLAYCALTDVHQKQAVQHTCSITRAHEPCTADVIHFSFGLIHTLAANDKAGRQGRADAYARLFGVTVSLGGDTSHAAPTAMPENDSNGFTTMTVGSAHIAGAV